MKKIMLLSLLLALGLTACASSDKKETIAPQNSQKTTLESSEVGSQTKSEENSPSASSGVSADGTTTESTDPADTEPDATETESTEPESIEPEDEYLNFAIFGLDVNTNLTKDEEGRWKQLKSGFRSDTIMIASINKTTGDIKLVSVYRDSFLNNGNDSYHKANAAYAKGGPLQAVKMLDMNLDMDIEKYIAISYHSMIDLVDGLGGITVDVEEAALNEINGYQTTIVNDLKLSGYTPVTESGPQVLNGLQVCAYCRLRHDFPRGDLDRAAHQRKVLRAIEAKAKQTDLKTLTSLFPIVFDEVYTNFDSKELLELVSQIDDYRIAGEGGFPTDQMVTIATLGSEGSCVVPMNLENNVIWLHQFLFEDEDYTPSETVQEINATIESKIAPYVKSR